MIPDTITTKFSDATVLPSLTYKIDETTGQIAGKIDGKEAVMQTIKNILNTERYAYEIYDWTFGVEVLKLAGQDFAYVEARLPNLVNEALLQDDRILETANWQFTKTDMNSLTAVFQVNTIFGDLDYKLEVQI